MREAARGVGEVEAGSGTMDRRDSHHVEKSTLKSPSKPIKEKSSLCYRYHHAVNREPFPTRKIMLRQ